MLCRGALNEPVATWLGDWHLADARFASAEALDPVVLYFESNAGLASSAFGPFEAFHVSGAAGAGGRSATAAAGATAAATAAAGATAASGTAAAAPTGPAAGGSTAVGAPARSLTAFAGSRLLASLDERSLLWYPPRAHDGWASVLIAPPGRSRFDLMRERPTGTPGSRPR
ncbi:MAG TPA: hypothetical protein VN730_09430 [Steroidobacteraceae bacterium]|nr:hypothetical protein [Steroidobacteraceae bacterium]